MREQLITFETAILAKEKGFKLGAGWEIRSLYNIKDQTTFCEKTKPTPKHACERCTQSLLQKWLREEYGIHIKIMVVDDSPNKWCAEVYKIDGTHITYSFELFELNNNELFKSYEEVLELALQEALKLIKL